jgi:hypothetical protein
MMKTRKRRVLIPSLLLALGIAIAAGAAGAADKQPNNFKAGRDTPAVMKDIKAGKAKKVQSEVRTFGVWDGCKFHYLRAEQNTYRFDDGSEAGVSENPDPGPQKDKDCIETRNPTVGEMAAMDKKVAELNPKRAQTPGGPPPAQPGERPADSDRGGDTPTRP